MYKKPFFIVGLVIPTVLIKAVEVTRSLSGINLFESLDPPSRSKPINSIRPYISIGVGESMAFDRTADLLLNYYINGSTTPAFTQSRPSYILRSNNKITMMPSVAVGLEYRRRWNFELGYSYTENSLDVKDDDSFTTNTIKSHTILANTIFKVLPDKKLNPYLGVGLGVGSIEDANKASIFLGALSGNSIEFDTKKVAALTASSIMGAELMFNKNMSLGAEYNLRYTNLKRSQTQSINTPVAAAAPGLPVDMLDLRINFKDYFSHNLCLKLRYYF